MLKVANSVISASRITGVLPVVNGGTGVTTSTGTGNTVLSDSPTFTGTAVFATLSGTGYNFSTSAPANSLVLDSSGNLLLSTASALNGPSRLALSLTSSQPDAIHFKPTSNITYYPSVFINSSGSTVGFIEATNVATSYSTSSDYRLKNTIAPMTGALAKVALLKPCTYKWNVNDSNGQGFIAHELQAVVPECVTGKKDAVDTDGNPKYQGIDTSFLVAILTAAIQELKTEFDTYKAFSNANR